MLAAHAQFDAGLGGAGAAHALGHQGAHAVDVDGLEGGDAEDPRLDVAREEHALHVVAREPPHGLGEVVGAEGEEVGLLGQVLGGHGGARQLDHGADGDAGQVGAALGGDLGDDRLALLAHQLELAHGADQRHHDLRLGAQAARDQLGRGLAQGAHLQGEQAGQVDAQADAAQAQHGVLLVHTADLGQHRLVGGIEGPGGLADRDPGLQVDQRGHELVQRRVDEAHGHGLAVHDLQHLQEVLLLEPLQLVEGRLALGGAGGGEDGALDQGAALAQEHVLGAAQADALGAELDGALGVEGGVGVGAHAQAADLVGVGEDEVHGPDELAGALVVPGGRQPRLEALGEVGGDGRVGDGHLAAEDLAGLPVDGDDVLARQDQVADRDGAGLGVDLEGLRAAHAGLAHAPGHDGGVRGLAAARGEHALGGDHAGQVVGVGLAAHEDALDARFGGGLGLRVVEDDASDCGARRRGHTGGDQFLVSLGVELREHQLGELVAGDAAKGLVAGDELLLAQLHGDAEGGRSRALADAGLQHPQFAALDGELNVAHVAVVGLEFAHDGAQLVVHGLVDALQVGQGQSVADSCDDVLALRVLQVVAVDAGVARGGVAGEAHARAGVLAHIAEHHGADVDGGAQVVGDALAPAVDAGALGVPGAEHGLDGHVHLGARVLGEVLAGLVAHDPLEGVDEAAQVVGGQFGVPFDAALGLEGVEGVGEEVAVDVEHRLAEHLDEAAVGVPREALVARHLGQADHGLVVEADVEDGLHHARHGELRAGAHGDQQGVVGVAEVALHLVLHAAQGGGDLGGQGLGDDGSLQVGAARLRGDGEPGGDRQAELRHLGEVRPLPPEQVLHGLVALGEVVHVLDHRGPQLPFVIDRPSTGPLPPISVHGIRDQGHFRRGAASLDGAGAGPGGPAPALEGLSGL